MRDTLNIKPEGYSAVGETPRDQRLRMTSAKRALKAAFMSLPKPENNFELLPLEDEAVGEVEGAVVEDDSQTIGMLDSKQLLEEEEQKALARRTQVVQHARGPLAPALVHAELVDLLQHDSIHRSGEVCDGQRARDTAGLPERELKQGVTVLAGLEEVDETLSWAHIRRQLRKIAGISALLDERRETMAKEGGKAEKNLSGYEARSKGLSKRIKDASSEMQKAKVDYESVVRQRTNESATGPAGESALERWESCRMPRRQRLQRVGRLSDIGTLFGFG
ncbi:pre-mRNA splicing factor component-domain-containing protein [Sparassis latifolia]